VIQQETMSQHSQTEEFTRKLKLCGDVHRWSDPNHQSSLCTVIASWLLLSVVATPNVSVGFAYIPILCKGTFSALW